MAALSFIIFSLLYIAPGDPAKSLVGTKKATPELLAQIRAEFGLDDPFFTQFGHWAKNALSGDFGTSIRMGQSVLEYAAPHIVATFQLVAIALVFSIAFGIITGIIAANGRGKIRDTALNTISLVGTSAPTFAMGLFFLYIFALKFGWFPLYGLGDTNFADRIHHLILPAIVLTFGVSTLLMKITRAALLTEVEKDYTLFLRARAISPFRITLAQLKNASAPILTSAGLLLANLFGGVILVENVFSIPGLGALLASSVTFHDVPVVQFIALLLAFIVCLCSAVVDIVVYALDPASRTKKRIFVSETINEGAGI